MSSADGARPPRTTFRYSGISSRDDGVPWAISNTPVRGSRFMRFLTLNLLSGLLMDVSRGGLHVFDGCHRQNAVSKIKDVTRAAAGALEHVVNGREQAIERGEQDCRIQIALNGA